ncbi:MAG: hypothetical protein O3C27_00210 [Actinomycetota bacterium]|nr:hypothetical protein [Actinomycetota bacterium]
MPIDLEAQLTRYGEVLEQAMRASAPAVSRDLGAAATIPGSGHLPGHRRVVYLAVVLAVVLGVGGVLVDTRGSAQLSGAVAIEIPADIELRAGDTLAFLQRLEHVDFELRSSPTGHPRADDGGAQTSEVKPLWGFTYGCAPTRELFGRRFGKRDFSAQIFMPGTPGVIFTLENGDRILVRPLDDRVYYHGPLAAQMEIFEPEGGVQAIDTSDCR